MHEPATIEAFVPQGDEIRMLQVLGRNLGNHLQAAVDNLLHDNRSHFEQALFADGLSVASVTEFRQLVRDQWQGLLDALVPALEAMVARDAVPDGAADTGSPTETVRHQIRLGLFTFSQAQAVLPALPVAASTTQPMR